MRYQKINHYTYRAEWSPEYGEYIGRCVEFPPLFRMAPTAGEAIEQIQQAVDQHVDDLALSGETVPTPLTERRYSGNFVVRTSTALHARLAMEAMIKASR